MRHFRALLIILLSISTLASCKSSDDSAPTVVKTGLELIPLGSIANFGNVTVGEYREASVQINNHGEEVTNFAPSLVSPFSVSRISAPCNSGSIPKNSSCQLFVRFTPSSPGAFSENLVVGDKVQAMLGRGLDSASYVQYSTSSWDLGNAVVAGSVSIRDLSITNAGDYTIAAPVAPALDGYTLVNNGCGSYISAKKTCVLRYSIMKKTVGTHSDALVFTSIGTIPFTLTTTSTVIPGPPSKAFTILNPPAYVVANGHDVKFLSTSPITDEYNNVVAENTSVEVSLFNLDRYGECYKLTLDTSSPEYGKLSYLAVTKEACEALPKTVTEEYVWQTSPTYKTKKDGTISFNIVSQPKIINPDSETSSTITIKSGSATSFARFPSIAGHAVGAIDAPGYVTSTEANGISQIDFQTTVLLDELQSVVVDGTEVYAEVEGLGTLVSATQYTVNGRTSFTVKTPTKTGTGALIIKAGLNNGAAPCGWSACGRLPFTYTPGLASGNIQVAADQSGIFADPSSGLQASPPETIQSLITLGPLKDKFNNLLPSGTSINVTLTNAIGVYGDATGKDAFSVLTNTEGFATFSLQGTNVRGFITITASKDTASGSGKLWAYNMAFIRADRPGLPSNPYKIYMSYHAAGSDPLPNENWGLVKTWNNIDIQDKNYFGDIKRSAPPTKMSESMPYFLTHCLFSSGSVMYGSNCFDSTFDSQYPTLRISKISSGGDPAGSVITSLSNGIRPSNLLHTINRAGCYKRDSDVNSPTYNKEIFYSQASEEVCNSQTSTDASSPLYYNEIQPWFGGTWYSEKYYTLRYPTSGFIPDLGKSLLFGGFYEIPTFGGYGSVANSYETISSSRNTWALSNGQGTPFAWYQDGNVENIYGDMPRAAVNPTTASSGLNLFMFGGLDLSGESQSPYGETTHYANANAATGLYSFNGADNKWEQLSPGRDPLVTNDEEPSSPSARFQNGMVYVPDNDTLFVGAGITRADQSNFWFEPNDLWSIKNISDREAEQNWQRRCSPCGFSANAHNYTYFNSNLLPGTLDPANLRMEYHPYFRKVFMLWSNKGYEVSSFDPISSSGPIVVNHTNNYSFNALQGTDLFDMAINGQTGRTYFYKRKTKNTNDSELYYWDMDQGMKQFMKFEVDIGSDAKNFARSINVSVRGYGKITDNTPNATILRSGIRIKIFNFTTNSWITVGENVSTTPSTDTPERVIYKNFDSSIVKDLISPEGKVVIIAYPKGDGDGQTEYLGAGYNEIRIDELYIGGLF